jgi:hypothetical protein
MRFPGQWRTCLLVALVGTVVYGCSSDDEQGPRNDLVKYNSEVVSAWFNLFLDITKVEKLSPPVASRAFAYEGVALYEAVVPGLGTHRSLVGQLNGLESIPQPVNGASYHWPSVANAALAALARQIYSGASAASLQAIADLEASFEAEFAPLAGATVFARSTAHGEAIGEAIYEWAFDDGYSQYNNCLYTPPQGSGLWVPTPPAKLPALQPCWGNLRNFVMDIPSRCDPIPPPPFDDLNTDSPFYVEMLEVFNTTNTLTNEQRDIARFWSDGSGTITPPGHWFAILNQLSDSSGWTLDVSSEAYAKVGIATGEAFISCWRAKYMYNYLRPITCIQNTLEMNWSPLITTPPFPEYPSGHSTQSAAVAHVLTEMFGHVAFDDHTYDGTFAARSFSSFFDAAEEAKISRLYGGIHFRSAIEFGFQQGLCVGEKVDALQFRR